LSDGNRLAIGTQYNANSIYPAKVIVYTLDVRLQPPDWKMIGNMTDYSPPANQSDLSAVTFHHYLHYPVLSGNGQVLVIIKIKSDLITDANGIYDAELSYITHKWNSTIGSSRIGSWDVMDDKGGLLSKTHKNQFANFNVQCFALSDDGNVLAVCSNLSIAVFSWNLDNSSWISRDVDFSRALTV
jgi:hypothetical protein